MHFHNQLPSDLFYLMIFFSNDRKSTKRVTFTPSCMPSIYYSDCFFNILSLAVSIFFKISLISKNTLISFQTITFIKRFKDQAIGFNSAIDLICIWVMLKYKWFWYVLLQPFFYHLLENSNYYTLKIKKPKNLPFLEISSVMCRWPDSNQHSINRSRFWIYRVYQFRHIGLKNKTRIEYLRIS